MRIPEDKNPLWWLFTAGSKADFLKRARAVTLSQRLIDRTALFAATGKTPLRHKAFEREFHPVILTDSDWKHVRETKDARKLLAAVTLHNRKRYHVFWFDVGERKPWWLFSFDLRDRKTHGNHWNATGSPHTHAISYLTHPRDKIETLIEGILFDPKYKLPHAVHIRFEDDGWQDWVWGT